MFMILMRVSDIAIIFFSLSSILFGFYLYSSSLSLIPDLRYEYASLCPSPLFSPVVSYSFFVAINNGVSVNLSVWEWSLVDRCVSYDRQIIR